MISIDAKSKLVEEHERRFAYQLASHVIQKPALSIWMILVPIIFIYFFYRLNQYKAGRHEFVKNYMVSRKRALATARRSLETGISADLAEIAKQARLPVEVLPEYQNFLAVFNEFYVELLQGKGDNFNGLVRSAFNTKTDYLLWLNRLNQIEQKLDRALKSHMADTTEGFDDIVAVIEQKSAELRREAADTIFTDEPQHHSASR